MRIAVNTRFLKSDNLEGFGVYTHEIMQRMALAHEQDDFLFCTDRKLDPKFMYADNIRAAHMFPPARHPALFVIWYQLRLRKFVEAQKANVLFSPDSFMPLGMRVPTVITIHDVAYKRFPDLISNAHRRYYEMYMPRFVRESAHIITVSEFSKREICHFFDVDPGKITVVYNGVSTNYKPLTESEKGLARVKYANGKPYFLYVGAIHPRKNVAALIKAFDQFKQSTGSPMQLLVAGRQSWQFGDVVDAYNSSHYSQDIKRLGYIPAEEIGALMGGAFAMTYVSKYEGFGLPVAEAMSCGVPVITSSAESSGGVLAEVGGDAILAVDPDSVESIARGMLRLFKDDDLVQSLVRQGPGRASLFSWDVAARETYKVLKQYARKH